MYTNTLFHLFSKKDGRAIFPLCIVQWCVWSFSFFQLLAQYYQCTLLMSFHGWPSSLSTWCNLRDLYRFIVSTTGMWRRTKKDGRTEKCQNYWRIYLYICTLLLMMWKKSWGPLIFSFWHIGVWKAGVHIKWIFSAYFSTVKNSLLFKRKNLKTGLE